MSRIPASKGVRHLKRSRFGVMLRTLQVGRLCRSAYSSQTHRIEDARRGRCTYLLVIVGFGGLAHPHHASAVGGKVRPRAMFGYGRLGAYTLR
jgi:hypothetical protein